MRAAEVLRLVSGALQDLEPGLDARWPWEGGDDGRIGLLDFLNHALREVVMQRPDATAEIIKNGWLHTGDIAVMDEEGFLRIVDRKKDMILVSGFNVYPNEIEDVVMQHAGVQEVAAVGVPSGSSGEAVKIFVVKKDASLTDEALVTFCRRHLTGYKVPKLVEFRDELPKSNVGKILRRELRDEARAKVDNKG